MLPAIIRPLGKDACWLAFARENFARVWLYPFKLLMNDTMHKCAPRESGLVFPYRGFFPLVALLLSGCVLWFPGPIAWAQGPAPEAPEIAESPTSVAPDDATGGTQPDQPISLEEVPGRAEITSAEWLHSYLATFPSRLSSGLALKPIARL